MRNAWIAGMILVLVSIGAPMKVLSSTDEENGCDNRMVVTKKDMNSQIKVVLGEVIEVRLDVSPGTGYSWHPKGDLPKILSPHGKSYFRQKSEKELQEYVGTSETQVIEIEATGTGTCDLVFVHKRPWEKPDKTHDQFEVTLVIFDAQNDD